MVKAASALFNGGKVIRPKDSARSSKGLNDLGYSERIACRVVGMSRSTYRHQKTRHPSNREVRRILLTGQGLVNPPPACLRCRVFWATGGVLSS